MRAYTHMHRGSDFDKSGNASCAVVGASLAVRLPALDYTVSVPDGERYKFLSNMLVNDQVFVADADKRLRSAVGNYARRWRKHFTTSAVDGGLVVERVS